MDLINVRNVHEALPVGMGYIRSQGVHRESRAGDVLVANGPVTTVFHRPTEMCCLWPERDVNPFATLFEGLWMLAGRNDVGYLTRFIARFAEFSDDGETLHGAYGERWRNRWGIDQLAEIIEALKVNPDCRRQILQIWDPATDLGRDGRDFPCNVSINFQINAAGSLDMIVFNRSNDMVWGTYGADAPHFGMLIQYVAAGIGAPVGRYWQISSNFHAYLATLEPLEARLAENAEMYQPYEDGLRVMDMMAGSFDVWNSDLAVFMEDEDRVIGYRSHFFRRIALPMIKAHNAFKQCDGEAKYIAARAELRNMAECDWRIMCDEWLKRRHGRYLEKKRVD